MKFLHISDIHFNPVNEGFSTRNLRRKFETYVKDKGIVDINEIFFTGDFRHASEQAGENIDEVAANTVRFLRYIAECVGVKDDSHIHIVPGNHDLDRHAYTHDKIEDKIWREKSKEDLKKVYDNYDSNKGQFLKDVDGVPALDYLRSRFAFFEKCVYLLNNKIWCDFSTKPIHQFKDYGEYCIIYMNTVIASGYKNDRGNLIIGLDDFDKAISNVEGKPLFILAHNPPEHLHPDERNKIKNILNDNKIPVLWFCGDTHKAGYNKSYDIACISVGAMIQQEGTESGFYVGEFNNSRLTYIMAHKYDSNHMNWQPEEALTERICQSIPDQINGITDLLFQETTKNNLKKKLF